MENLALVEKLTKIFIKEAYGRPTANNETLSIDYGIQLTPISNPMRMLQYRYQVGGDEWIRPENLTWEKGYLGDETPPNWDVKADGSEIVHCVAPLTFYFYKVTQLSDIEIERLKEEKIKQELKQNNLG